MREHIKTTNSYIENTYTPAVLQGGMSYAYQRIETASINLHSHCIPIRLAATSWLKMWLHSMYVANVWFFFGFLLLYVSVVNILFL